MEVALNDDGTGEKAVWKPVEWRGLGAALWKSRQRSSDSALGKDGGLRIFMRGWDSRGWEGDGWRL